MAKDKAPAPEPTAGDSKVTDSNVTSDASTPIVAPADDTPKTKVSKSAKLASWFRITVIVLFGLLYAWDLFEAVSNLFGKMGELARVNEVRELNGFAPIDTPWAFLITNLLLPVVVFGLALVVARKRNVGNLAMVLLAGLGVIAAISLSITSFVLQTT